MDYGFTFNGTVCTPNGTPGITPAESDARNKALEAAELQHWAGAPDRFTAYYHFDGHVPAAELAIRRTGRSAWLAGAEIRTWLGTKLGIITAAVVYRHNFGGRFVAIRAIGSNGAEYHGRASWDNGEIIRLRRCK